MAGRYSDYDRFAWLYNRHWTGFSQMILPLLDRLVLGEAPPPARVLDVGCGTGHLAAQLIARGYTVTGLDGSAEMLAYARANAPQAEFLLEDARRFSLAPTFDLALSTFDSLNHILALDELQTAFRNVYRALVPGGRFYFDMNLEQSYLDGWAGATGDAFEDYAYIWRNEYDPDERLSQFVATLFRLEDGLWQRSDVTLWQRPYSIEQILGALQAAGFTDFLAARSNEELALVPLDETARRGFFVARKPG